MEQLLRTTNVSHLDSESQFRMIKYMVICGILVYIVHSLLLSRIYKKAGQKSWKACVPFLRDWVFFEMGAYKGANIFWIVGAVLLNFITIPIMNAQNNTAAFVVGCISMCLVIVYAIYKILAVISVQQKFGKPGAYFVLYFINLVAPLWVWILALDNSKYNKKKGHQK